MEHRTVFFTLVNTPEQMPGARLLVDSLRAFGGTLRDCPFWLFTTNSQTAAQTGLQNLGVEIIPLILPKTVANYWFAGKVFAAAQAEKSTPPGIDTLVWLSPDTLVIKPPVLFDLGSSYDAAVRPVHIRNVGINPQEPLDDFWRGVYQQVGVDDIQATVTSFVDGETLRAYFNSHVYAINPYLGLLQEWFDHYEALVGDQVYQHTVCQDALNQIFLHQAILSGQIATRLKPSRVRILPTDYSYPYNLHARVPSQRRARVLNELVCIAYEDRSLYPEQVSDIRIDEPLKTWLATRADVTRS